MSPEARAAVQGGLGLESWQVEGMTDTQLGSLIGEEIKRSREGGGVDVSKLTSVANHLQSRLQHLENTRENYDMAPAYGAQGLEMPEGLDAQIQDVAHALEMVQELMGGQVGFDAPKGTFVQAPKSALDQRIEQMMEEIMDGIDDD